MWATDKHTAARQYLFLISAAIVMKACSTFVAFLALVSRKGMPISSAKAWRAHEDTSAYPHGEQAFFHRKV